MTDTLVKLKNGRTFCGPIMMFRPKEGWFSVLDAEADNLGEGAVRIEFDDCESAVTKGERISVSRFGDCDELERARKQGWQPKRFRVSLQDPGIFVYVDGVEVIYWDTTDSSHAQQGYEIAEGLKTLYEDGPDKFVEWTKQARQKRGF